MGLDLRDAEVFVTVARHGSFGRAATELVVTQPAVSERVRHLERVCGRRLFERTTRGASLTPAGERLLPYAHRCLALADEALEIVRRSEGVAALAVAVHSTFAQRVIPMVLGALAEVPRRVTIRDAHSHEVEALVVDGVADLGFVIPGPRRRGLTRRALPPDPVVASLAPSHPLARQPRPTLNSLRDSYLAINAWGDGTDALLQRAQDAGIPDWRIRYCADATTALILAREHSHIAFTSKSSTSSDVDSGHLRPLTLAGMPRWSIHLDLLYRTADRPDPAISAIEGALTTTTKR
jgi:DNA-binding transcriptional LysR family regulator